MYSKISCCHKSLLFYHNFLSILVRKSPLNIAPLIRFRYISMKVSPLCISKRREFPSPAYMCDTGLELSWKNGRQHIANLPRCNMFPNRRVSWFILFEPQEELFHREQRLHIPLFTTKTTIT